MGEPLIELKDVRKVYYKNNFEVPVLDGLTLSIPAGQFSALMGPSGSGKSTLLNLIGGLDSATAGTVRVGDTNLTDMSESQLTAWRSRHVGFIFQQYHLVPVLTAAQNVELPLLLFKMGRAERAERAKTALEVVGLADRMDHRPNQLSGGQEQRVAIARAIVTDPDLILADEPTGNLDAANAAHVSELMFELVAMTGAAMVLVTHDEALAARADRTVRLRDGRVAEPA